MRAGDQLDNYYVEALVARAGVGSVFRCTDLRTGGRVALKVLHAGAESDPVMLGRFYREQEIGRTLDHPGVVKVMPPALEQSHLYTVMQWAAGRSLRAILEEQPRLLVRRAIRIAEGICEALEYIHGEGVVHRDLKPENVMVDAEDRVMLIDFGIADRAEARRLTFGELAQVMGTPDYISPEQLKGKRADARSDIYALGVMLYEMVTGRTPFSGANPFAIMNDRLLNKPPPAREIVPEIPGTLEEVISRALERDPRRRYKSARVLGDALKAAMEPTRRVFPRPFACLRRAT